MTRPQQVVPLFVAAGALWLLHVLLPLTAHAASQRFPWALFLAVPLAGLALWAGAMLAGSALLLLVLTWDRRHHENAQHTEGVATSHDVR